jgi:hypothetical protein
MFVVRLGILVACYATHGCFVMLSWPVFVYMHIYAAALLGGLSAFAFHCIVVL